MQQVAERAGVAVSSVSRVLSGHPNVSEVMRNRVTDAVSALGYEMDLLAQSLRRGSTMTVGFVISNIANPMLSEVALGAETSLRNAGYAMLLTNSMEDPELDCEHIRLLTQRRVDGLLLSVSDETYQGTIDAIYKTALPVVLVDREMRVSGRVSAVQADHAIGVAEAARQLAMLGHKRIALVNGPQTLRPPRERANTLRRISRQFSVSSSVRSGKFTAAHGEESTAGLLAQSEPPTAIIAGSNQILVGVMRELRRLGYRIPQDISVVTCDDVPLAELMVPSLAAIERDNYEIGVIAASLLSELLNGATPRVVTVPTSFHLRPSIGPPANAASAR